MWLGSRGGTAALAWQLDKVRAASSVLVYGRFTVPDNEAAKKAFHEAAQKISVTAAPCCLSYAASCRKPAASASRFRSGRCPEPSKHCASIRSPRTV